MKSSDEDRPTWTEAHRHACEVRMLLGWQREDRLRYYGLVAKARGQQAAKALRDAVSAEWRRRNDPAGA